MKSGMSEHDEQTGLNETNKEGKTTSSVST